MDRPHITVVLAASIDGKIAARDRSAARFSSPADQKHLESLVAQADGVLFGAATLRAYGTCLSVRQPPLLAARKRRQQPPQPIQIVCSQTGKLDPELRFFRQLVPRWLLTSETGATHWSVHPEAFECILPLLSMPTDWAAILRHLTASGIERLALLGGGALVASLVEQGYVDEFYLTVCPLLLGGKLSPTPVDGQGLPLQAAIAMELVDIKRQGSEVFLHYRRCHRFEV